MSQEQPISRAFLETHGLTPGAADYVMRHFEQEIDNLIDQRDTAIAAAKDKHSVRAEENTRLREELERAKKEAAAMRGALRKAHPKTGAWDVNCQPVATLLRQ